MKPKIVFIVMIALLYLILGLFVVEGYSATAKQNEKTTDGNTRRDIKSYGTCTSIAPEVGTIIENTQIGDTWYDFQKSGSMGRMISVSSAGHRHVSWMYTNGVFPGVPRYVKGNCKPPAGVWIGAQSVDGGTTNAGYSNQTHLSDGTSLVFYHRIGGSPIWYSAISADDAPCGGFFTRKYDIPDYISNAPSGEAGLWPKGEVQHDAVSGRDYIHVVMTEGNSPWGYPPKGQDDAPPSKYYYVPVMVAYERCYIKDSIGLTDPMYCQSYVSGATQTYRMLPGANGGGAVSPISHFDSSCGVTPVVAVSPVSRRVAIAYLKPSSLNGSCDSLSDVCFIESMSNGDDWIDGTNWPPPEYKITNYGGKGLERAFNDVSACYDYQDSLHVVYITTDLNSNYSGRRDPHVARLYHWCKKYGSVLINTAIWGGTTPDAHSCNIAKASISAQDPVYHPGGDSVFLYCIWTQFDSADNADNGYSNGEIYGSGSDNGGNSWSKSYNLTNTQTPNCHDGNCLSEQWPSLAKNMYNGDLHIQYICDRDAGGAAIGEGYWTDNPVMYLDLAAWPVMDVPGISVKIISPSTWYGPPLKVTPSGSRYLTYKVYSIGNANLLFSVSSDNSCIWATVTPTVLAPRDSATLTATVSGTGACNNTFINGNINIASNDPDQPSTSFPVQAVVSNDYYECPNDPVTNDTLKNGVFNFYINANGQEWIHDTSFAVDTTHDVFFQGGAFIATKIAGDTLVGRYYGTNDQHTLAREKLVVNPESTYTDFWLAYSWNVSIHDLNPPVDTKWWWFDMLHENVFFKPTASDDLKHTVIKFVTAERHDPPTWWPSQPAFTSYEDTYIGMMMDIDCPYDTFAGQNARNRAGYDAVNNIAWQRGWDYTGANPSYNDYYAGLALAQGSQTGESAVPWGTYNLRNDVYLYPQSPWGWKDGDFYRLAAGNTLGYVQQPDSIVDRSQILTARKVPAGSTSNLKVSFTVIEAVGTTPGIGPTQLAARVAAARAWVASKPFILCGDVNNSGVVDAGDIVTLINYLFKYFPPSTIIDPKNRADCNSSDGKYPIEVGDIVILLSYLYKGGLPPKCPGVW